MKNKIALYYISFLFLFVHLSYPTFAENELMIQINLDEKQQSVEGFGASGAWWAQDIGAWDDENRNRVIELLFNSETGIGLSMYRYNIGAGERHILDTWRGTDTYEVAAGEYDWTQDANARWVLRAAYEAGVQDFIAFSNSPTPRMTVSGLASGHREGDSNLLPEMHEDYAVYLLDVMRFLIEEEGIPFQWLSPINEPQWDWQPSKGQEGNHYTTDEIVSVLTHVQQQIDASGLDIHLSVIDAGEWGTANIYANRIFADNYLRENIDHFAVHSYWSDNNARQSFTRFMANNHPEMPVWMSEWTEMQSGRDYGMESALILANTIHDDLTVGGVTSWQYWIAVSKYNYRDGLIYTNENTEDIEETKRLWAMGNYSRFIRPNAKRLTAASPNEQVRVTVFLNENGSLVLVLINNSNEEQSISLDGIADYNSISAYTTSDSQNLALSYFGTLQSTYPIPAQSVTTLVLTGG
jgi:O-glycosyl hydrolase